MVAQKVLPQDQAQQDESTYPERVREYNRQKKEYDEAVIQYEKDVELYAKSEAEYKKQVADAEAQYQKELKDFNDNFLKEYGITYESYQNELKTQEAEKTAEIQRQKQIEEKRKELSKPYDEKIAALEAEKRSQLSAAHSSVWGTGGSRDRSELATIQNKITRQYKSKIEAAQREKIKALNLYDFGAAYPNAVLGGSVRDAFYASGGQKSLVAIKERFDKSKAAQAERNRQSSIQNAQAAALKASEAYALNPAGKEYQGIIQNFTENKPTLLSPSPITMQSPTKKYTERFEKIKPLPPTITSFNKPPTQAEKTRRPLINVPTGQYINQKAEPSKPLTLTSITTERKSDDVVDVNVVQRELVPTSVKKGGVFVPNNPEAYVKGVTKPVPTSIAFKGKITQAPQEGAYQYKGKTIKEASAVALLDFQSGLKTLTPVNETIYLGILEEKNLPLTPLSKDIINEFSSSAIYKNYREIKPAKGKLPTITDRKTGESFDMSTGEGSQRIALAKGFTIIPSKIESVTFDGEVIQNPSPDVIAVADFFNRYKSTSPPSRSILEGVLAEKNIPLTSKGVEIITKVSAMNIGYSVPERNAVYTNPSTGESFNAQTGEGSQKIANSLGMTATKPQKLTDAVIEKSLAFLESESNKKDGVTDTYPSTIIKGAAIELSKDVLATIGDISNVWHEKVETINFRGKPLPYLIRKEELEYSSVYAFLGSAGKVLAENIAARSTIQFDEPQLKSMAIPDTLISTAITRPYEVPAYVQRKGVGSIIGAVVAVGTLAQPKKEVFEGIKVKLQKVFKYTEVPTIEPRTGKIYPEIRLQKPLTVDDANKVKEQPIEVTFTKKTVSNAKSKVTAPIKTVIRQQPVSFNAARWNVPARIPKTGSAPQFPFDYTKSLADKAGKVPRAVPNTPVIIDKVTSPTPFNAARWNVPARIPKTGSAPVISSTIQSITQKLAIRMPSGRAPSIVPVKFKLEKIETSDYLDNLPSKRSSKPLKTLPKGEEIPPYTELKSQAFTLSDVKPAKQLTKSRAPFGINYNVRKQLAWGFKEKPNVAPFNIRTSSTDLTRKVPKTGSAPSIKWNWKPKEKLEPTHDTWLAGLPTKRSSKPLKTLPKGVDEETVFTPVDDIDLISMKFKENPYDSWIKKQPKKKDPLSSLKDSFPKNKFLEVQRQLKIEGSLLKRKAEREQFNLAKVEAEYKEKNTKFVKDMLDEEKKKKDRLMKSDRYTEETYPETKSIEPEGGLNNIQSGTSKTVLEIKPEQTKPKKKKPYLVSNDNTYPSDFESVYVPNFESPKPVSPLNAKNRPTLLPAISQSSKPELIIKIDSPLKLTNPSKIISVTKSASITGIRQSAKEKNVLVEKPSFKVFEGIKSRSAVRQSSVLESKPMLVEKVRVVQVQRPVQGLQPKQVPRQAQRQPTPSLPKLRQPTKSVFKQPQKVKQDYMRPSPPRTPSKTRKVFGALPPSDKSRGKKGKPKKIKEWVGNSPDSSIIGLYKRTEVTYNKKVIRQSSKIDARATESKYSKALNTNSKKIKFF